jgi:ABC-type transport system involved in Fe-S cluster assembly fused permease/ATPase subunit
MRLSHSRLWLRIPGLPFVLLHGGALVLLFCSPSILTTSPYYVIRTQFRRQANSADNKAATVAVDSLLNYEAVKVRTRYSSRVGTSTITQIEFQQRAVRGRTVRYALACV